MSEPTKPIEFSAQCPEFVTGLIVPEPEVIAALPRDLALEFSVVPLWFDDMRLYITVSDPLDYALFDTLRGRLDCELEFVAAPFEETQRVLQEAYGVISPPPAP
jgi:hypothetical protein